MSRRNKKHRRLSQLETLEKRNLLAFGIRSFLATSFHDASVPAAEVARTAVVKTAPIVALSTIAAEVTPAKVAAAAPVLSFSAIQSLPSVESTPQAASLGASEDLESASQADSAQPSSVENSSAESLPTERASLEELQRADAQPNTSYQLTVTDVTLGTVTTDGAGDLSLELTSVEGQRDEGMVSDGSVDESLPESAEQVAANDSREVESANETSQANGFNDADGNADDFADVEASDSIDHQSFGDDGPTENFLESSGGEDSASSLDDVENGAHDASNSIDDSHGLSHELVDEVHSESGGVVGLADDTSNIDDLFSEQDSSNDDLGNDALARGETTEFDDQHAADSLSENHDDGSFDDESHVNDDLQSHESSLDSDHLGSGNDISDLSNGSGNDDGLSSDDVPVVAGSTTQAYGAWKTYLSGNGTAEIEFEKERGETEFEVEVRGFAPNGSFPVTIGGVMVGQIRTDSRGRGKLEYEIGDDHYRPFPTDFPVIEAGVTVQIGTQLSGVFGSARSGHHDD